MENDKKERGKTVTTTTTKKKKGEKEKENGKGVRAVLYVDYLPMGLNRGDAS